MTTHSHRTSFARRFRSLIVGWALVALGLPYPLAAEELGRLFTTPAQRQELDRRRTLNIQAAVVVREDLVTANGVVKRSSGKSTVWLNGRPQDDQHIGRDTTRVPVDNGEGAPALQVKVGETLDRTKGQSRDALDGGTISIKRPR